MNNPLNLIDPNGMETWEPIYKDNKVYARNENGEPYSDLFNQMNSTDAASIQNENGIDMNSSPQIGETIDISSAVGNLSGINPEANGSNCHGATAFLKNKSSSETITGGLDILGKLGNPKEVKNAKTGDVAVWNTISSGERYAQYNNTPAHTAIFLIKNNSGQSFFLNRKDTGEKISIDTKNSLKSYYVPRFLPDAKINFNEKYYRPK